LKRCAADSILTTQRGQVGSILIPLLKRLPDGGPSMGPHQEPQDTLGGSKFSSNIKEKAQALLHQLAALLRLNSTHKPGFVDLLEDDPD